MTSPTDGVRLAGSVYYATEDRPDPPALEGQCEVAGCALPQAVPCWSADWQEWFRYCEDCAAEKADEFPDLEVADDD